MSKDRYFTQKEGKVVEVESKKKKPDTDYLRMDNHILGCNIECIAEVLLYRGFNKEAAQLDEIASKIK